MNATFGIDRCQTFLNCQLQPPEKSGWSSAKGIRKCAITISRQSGCGAHVVTEKLAAYLQAHSPKDAAPWTVFDRNLVERVLEDHHLPKRIASHMPEDRVSQINDIIGELFCERPALSTLVQKTSETILHLAELGNAIILGRGANIITARLPHVLHVRLIGSLERRIEQMQQFEKLDRKEAARRIHDQDHGRQRYVKEHFGKDANDPLLYHLIINTDLVSADDAARIIADLALNRRVVNTVKPLDMVAA
jgi:cytidylate kinase